MCSLALAIMQLSVGATIRVCEACVCCSGDARIHSLNLSANNIGDKGAAALAEMLKVSAVHGLHLVHVNDSNNKNAFQLMMS